MNNAARLAKVDKAMERVSGNGSVQIGTYFDEAKILASEVVRLRKSGMWLFDHLLDAIRMWRDK